MLSGQDRREGCSVDKIGGIEGCSVNKIGGRDAQWRRQEGGMHSGQDRNA